MPPEFAHLAAKPADPANPFNGLRPADLWHKLRRRWLLWLRYKLLDVPESYSGALVLQITSAGEDMATQFFCCTELDIDAGGTLWAHYLELPEKLDDKLPDMLEGESPLAFCQRVEQMPEVRKRVLCYADYQSFSADGFFSYDPLTGHVDQFIKMANARNLRSVIQILPGGKQ